MGGVHKNSRWHASFWLENRPIIKLKTPQKNKIKKQLLFSQISQSHQIEFKKKEKLFADDPFRDDPIRLTDWSTGRTSGMTSGMTDRQTD